LSEVGLNILIVEDDIRLGQFLTKLISQNGMCPILAKSLIEIENTISSSIDVNGIFLDRLLDKEDTKAILPKLKIKYPKAPIIVVSAISTSNEKAELLDLGADDYIGKPFSSQELLSRLNASLRRTRNNSKEYLEIKNTIIDKLKRIVMVDGISLHLTMKEFLILNMLCESPGRVFSKNIILDVIWSANIEIETNVVESTINNLRRKIDSAGSEIMICNKRNLGYWVEI
jgi:two-component system, OmpR family, response regulator